MGLGLLAGAVSVFPVVFFSFFVMLSSLLIIIVVINIWSIGLYKFLLFLHSDRQSEPAVDIFWTFFFDCMSVVTLSQTGFFPKHAFYRVNETID